MQATKRVAKFDQLAVRKEAYTKEHARELAALLSRNSVSRVRVPDAVHWAIMLAIGHAQELGTKAAGTEGCAK